MGYQIGDRKLPLDVAWTDADGIQRPANWLRLSTERDRELLGITWVADSSNNYDQRFYWGVDNPKQLNDEAVLDEDGNDVVDADGNAVMIANPNLATAWPNEPS